MTRMNQELTRRTVFGAAAGLAAATMAPVLTLAQESSPVASPAGGEWNFTDDRGVTVTLPQRPTRIVCDLSAAAPLWDFGIRPLAVSGWTTPSDSAWGNVDRATTVINAVKGQPEPDNEALIDLGTELFVTISWGPDNPEDTTWSFSTLENLATAEAIAPVVAISATGSAAVNMERFAELAVLLGADLNTPELVTAREEYDASVAAFSQLTVDRAEISILFAYLAEGETGWYAAYAPDWADLAWYESLGLNIVTPNAQAGDYWEELSFEQALLYPSDVLFNSTRTGCWTPEQIKASDTFGLHPAVVADQIGGWNQDFILSYQGLKAALDNMVATISAAEKVV